MKPIWKHIIAAICALLVIAYMVFGLWMSHHSCSNSQYGQLDVLIEDQEMRQYVTALEIKNLIRQNNMDPSGKSKQSMSLQQIEKLVRCHSMVRTAECYKTVQGDVCVRLNQRVPLVKIVTGAESYFVDTVRKLMPVLESVKTPVLLVTGEVGRRMATHEITEFSEWLQDHSYWQQRISRVHVCNPKMVYLIQKDARATIILGDWKDTEQKLAKLRRWYEADPNLHIEQYQMADVRFDGQVVGIKNKE